MTGEVIAGWGRAVLATAEAGAPAACAPLPSEWAPLAACAPAAVRVGGSPWRVPHCGLAPGLESSEPPVTPLQPGDAAERPACRAGKGSPSISIHLSLRCPLHVGGGNP